MLARAGNHKPKHICCNKLTKLRHYRPRRADPAPLLWQCCVLDNFIAGASSPSKHEITRTHTTLVGSLVPIPHTRRPTFSPEQVQQEKLQSGTYHLCSMARIMVKQIKSCRTKTDCSVIVSARGNSLLPRLRVTVSTSRNSDDHSHH